MILGLTPLRNGKVVQEGPLMGVLGKCVFTPVKDFAVVDIGKERFIPINNESFTMISAITQQFGADAIIGCFGMTIDEQNNVSLWR